MITDKQKEEIFLKIAPFELYYDDDIYMEHIHNGVLQSLSNEFENETLFIIAVNDLLKLNTVLFFNAISKTKLTKIDFIDYVNSQFNRFKEDSEGEGLNEWLNHTKKIVFDKELYFYPKKVNTANKGAFMDWYNETLLSEAGKKKLSKPEPTFFDFIHNVTDKEAFAQDLKNTFNTEFGKDFTAIIKILESADIIKITDRSFQGFYNALIIYFDRDLGKYQSINDPRSKQKLNGLSKSESDNMGFFAEKLKPLIIKYKLK